jgi:tetratricopeptide (TPR) repeat protein
MLPTDKKQLEFEIQFYEGLLQRKKNQPEILKLLAENYTKCGDYVKGLQMDRALVQLCPNDPLVFYNLACSLSLTSAIDEAFYTLEKAIALGYRDARHMKRDKDLTPLKKDPRYIQILEKIESF